MKNKADLKRRTQAKHQGLFVLNGVAKWTDFVLNRVRVWRPWRHSPTQTSLKCPPPPGFPAYRDFKHPRRWWQRKRHKTCSATNLKILSRMWTCHGDQFHYFLSPQFLRLEAFISWTVRSHSLNWTILTRHGTGDKREFIFEWRKTTKQHPRKIIYFAPSKMHYVHNYHKLP